MATFRFSVGDFITLLTLVKDVTAALRESTRSASSYRSLIETLDALSQALTFSGLIYLQWEDNSASETHKQNCKSMINAMLVHRQRCKKLIEKFLESTRPYASSFLSSLQNRRFSITKNIRQITWMFQKDTVSKLERELQGHLTPLRMYSDALFQ